MNWIVTMTIQLSKTVTADSREQKWLKVPGDAVKELAKMLPQIWVK